jgi:hypothetical protein
MKQNNDQGEKALVAEWLQTFPASYLSKTNVNVGAPVWFYAGVPLTAAQSRAFSVTNDRVDARLFTGLEVWIIEGKIEARAGAYGQVQWYAHQYPASLDYQQFKPAPIVPIVLGMRTLPELAAFYAQFGVRTINFTPSFSLAQALSRLYPAAQVLGGTGAP